ncbi:two-component system response regulator CreB [Limnobaculum parvum]|uniref:Two-component system response regulator CreB n=1 Tax=Limnobaculum parvum TaxID=2172103 RepID=A0A2Y9U1B7_9GAMM|nr:two-component system response regulator CreB [Limnobaculum parvum]AWH89374.1 two-component system response regulator CreB [Limnobaculum parvum]
MSLIWLVEDEASIADTLIYTLETDGFEVRWFERGEPVLEALNHSRPALAILDVGLPDINGFDLCRRMLAQSADLPLIFLTARSEELDRIVGLEIGADDYIAKPFSPREVSARVRTILRRLEKQQRMLPSYGAFRLDEEGAIITFCGQTLLLTRYEFLLLRTLIKSPRRVFSRQQLMDLVWQDAEESLDRTVDTHIKTLRAKLRAVSEETNPIQTHRGLGYSLSPDK